MHDPEVYQFHAWLKGISPMVWRRLLLRSDQTVADLHYALQLAYDWSDSHLNSFRIRGKDFGVYHMGGPHFHEDPNEVGYWGATEQKTGLRDNYLQFQMVTRARRNLHFGAPECISATLPGSSAIQITQKGP